MNQSSTLHCHQCSNGYPADKFNHCPVCEIPLDNADFQQSQQFHGNNNQGIQIGGDNQGSVVINSVPAEPKKTLIHRKKIKPISIADTPVKHWWFTASGALGLVGNLASILGVWLTLGSSEQSPLPTFPIWFLLLSGFLFILGIGMWRSRYLNLPFSSQAIEISKDGQLYLTRVSGTCSQCDSPVEVRTIGPKEHRVTVVQCTNNPQQHRWEFDRTILGDVGDDYLR